LVAEILTIGTELLLGDITNTNAQHIASQLAAIGVSVYSQTVVGDNEERILAALERAFSYADLVITTGGLGPTEDDLTRETSAKHFGKKLIMHDEWLKKIEEHFAKQNLPCPPNNAKQAMLPEGTILLENNCGTAPGCIIEQGGKVLINLPGPPSEMKLMFERHVAPYLSQKQDVVLVSRQLKFCGIGESMLETQIADLVAAQENPTIAPYAGDCEVHLRITASADGEDEANALIEPVAAEIYNRLGEYIFAEGDETLEEVVVKKIAEHNQTLAVAESCTGGLLSGRLINSPGASEVFIEGIVSYSNKSKMERLGVTAKTLEEHGAVSSQTAGEMAIGVAEALGANVGVAITGIAGPGGGTDEKPVGLVYIAVFIDDGILVKKFNFAGDRARVRTRAVVEALNLLRKIFT